MNDIITNDGEVIESGVDQSLAVGLTRAEIDTQIATARRFPRSIKRATDAIFTLVTMDEETAAECNYALPRAGKAIQGPSIRLAEIIQQSWGNNRVSARIVHVDRTQKFVEAEGIYHDLETNSAFMARVRRRIVDSRGRIYSDDMIIVTGNAACSIAKRNAILAGVPKAVWRQAYEAARKVVAGDVKTLTARRDESVKAFANFGVKPEQIYEALGIVGLEDITIDHIPILRGMYSALKNGEETVETMFAKRSAPAHETVANPLADDDANSNPPAASNGAGDKAAEGGGVVAGVATSNGAESAATSAGHDSTDSGAAPPVAPEKAAGGKAGEVRPSSASDAPAADPFEGKSMAWRAGYEDGAKQTKKGALPAFLSGDEAEDYWAGWDSGNASKAKAVRK